MQMLRKQLFPDYYFYLYANSIKIKILSNDYCDQTYNFYIKNDKIDWNNPYNDPVLLSGEIIYEADKWMRKIKLSAFE